MAKNINVVLTLQDRFTKKMNEASYETLKFKRNLSLAQTVSDKFAGVMHKMETAAVTGLATAGTAITVAGKSALDAYEEFNNAMNKVEGIKGLGTTEEEMKSLTDTAKEAARNIKGITYNDAADALYYLAQAGMNTEQSMNAINGVLKAIKIQGGDAQTVADATTDSMETLGLASSKTGEYVDKCAAIQAAANTDMLQLEEAVKKCGSAMVTFGKKSGLTGEELDKNLNESVNDTLALIGLLSADKKGSEAGTAINSIYRRLVKDSAEAQDGLEELGLSVYDSAGNLKRAEPLFKEMGDLMENLTPKEKNSILSKIGGYYASDLQLIIDGIRNVSEETGMTLYEQLENTILAQEGKNGVNGAADAYINSIAKGYGGAVATLAASWTNFKIDAGEIIAPYATDVLNYIAGKLPVIQEWLENNLPSALDKGKEIVLEIKETLEGFKPVIQWIIDHWQQIALAAGAVYTGMGAFRIGTGALEAYDTISKFGKDLEKQKEARDSIFDNTPGLDLFQLLGDDELTKKGNPKNKKGTVKGADGNWYRKTSFDELKEKAKKAKSLDFDLDKELNINKQLTELDLLNWGNNIGFDLDTAKSKIPKFDYSKTRIPFYDTMLEFDHDDLVQKGLMDSNGLKNSFEEFSMYQDIVAEMRDTSKTGNKPGLLQRLFGGAKKGGSKALGAADDVAGKVTGLTSTSLMGAVSAGGEMAATATAGAVTGGGGTVGSIGGVASGVIGSGGTAGIVGSAVATAAPLIAIAAILAGAYTQSEKFRKSVKNFADTSLSGVTSGFEKVKDGIKKGWEAAQPFVDVLKEGLKNIGDLLAPVLNFLGPIVDGFFNIVGMGIGAVFEGIGTFLGKIGDAFKFINEVLDPFTSKIKEAWEWLSDLSEEFSEFIGKVVNDDPDTSITDYKTLNYTGDHSMRNGTSTSNITGNSNEAEGGEGEDSGKEWYIDANGYYKQGTVTKTTMTGEKTGAMTEEMQEREKAFNNEHKALGTNYWKGGITHVNERGGEIMDLPRGTRIYPADKSKKMMNEKSSPTVIVNIENFYGDDEGYVEKIGNRIAHKLAMEL